MKQVMKKVVAIALAMTIALGGMQTTQIAEAYTPEYNAFKNKWSVEDSGIGFITEKKSLEDLSKTIKVKVKGKTKERYITTGYVAQPNDNIYFVAPSGTQFGGKVVSVNSSNKKVAEVKDKEKGLIKLNNEAGKTWISYEVKYDYKNKNIWKYHKALQRDTLYDTGRKVKVIKNGKTCTMQYKALIYVSCQKGKHAYGAWKTVEKATCDESGLKERICKKCHHTETENIKATKEHKYGDWKVVNATCEDDGYKYRECKVCGHEEEVTTDKATGHNYDPTTHKCEYCGEYDPEYDENDDY